MKTCEGCRSGSWGRQGQLAEMEEELRYAPLSFRNPMMSKLRTYRKDLAKLHREVRSTPLTATPGGRGDMKYGSYAVENEHMNRLQSQRALLLQGTDSLNRATQSIERSHRIATETDQIGSEIIEELGEQRDQLERTKSRATYRGSNGEKHDEVPRDHEATIWKKSGSPNYLLAETLSYLTTSTHMEQRGTTLLEGRDLQYWSALYPQHLELPGPGMNE
ncbi:vesicle transport through interaction with t-SNAREs homolog 1B isoform X3 [Callorhinus ursinus]|uniref:vesicle transport through interaction with t-SNAREs homolog 1B isoform X3 n=1 Tax=Callorhinus ursinus TaxID=34884 RepID=UPI003CD00F77